MLGLATLEMRLGIVVLWVFNVVGTVDLFNAFFQGNRVGLGVAPGLQGAAYFITVLVPLLLVTHALVFRMLFRPHIRLERQQQRDLIARFVAAYNRFDVDEMLALVTEDVQFENVSSGQVTAAAAGAAEFRALA